LYIDELKKHAGVKRTTYHKYQKMVMKELAENGTITAEFVASNLCGKQRQYPPRVDAEFVSAATEKLRTATENRVPWLHSYELRSAKEPPYFCSKCRTYLSKSVMDAARHVEFNHSSKAELIAEMPAKTLSAADKDSNRHYAMLSSTIERMNHVHKTFDTSPRTTLFRIIEDALKSVSATASLHVFGSVVTGLWDEKSDMDFAIDCVEPEQSNRFLRRVSGPVRRALPGDRIFVISKTRVPILHIDSFSLHISCDVSLNNMNGCYNSELIRDYTTYDPRVLHFLFLVRDWGKKSGVINSGACFLTSYALVVMALLFLQIGLPNPVIPIGTSPELIKKAVEGEKELALHHLAQGYDFVHVSNWVSKDKSSPEELFHLFLVFYGYKFDFRNTFVDAKDGVARPKSELPEGISRVSFVIRDPFLRDFNVTERVDPPNADSILFSFRSMAHELLT